ncbi:MAG: hypothetical protein HQL84_11935 [Magnetococcales bacterium]|nr:hypothetical protein [Magnetococcales bacterium]MBF0150745.1 hypothetical protein [Magnetococcales bacterium]MBF0175171.1 hypothetical protein [Magnetococcales bacterium]MBF0346027.1 hypothetical protein [Magnetococcales bacterium]MBF0631835.1 hypothetical protein [Magnetococcales bacterium]
MSILETMQRTRFVPWIGKEITLKEEGGGTMTATIRSVIAKPKSTKAQSPRESFTINLLVPGPCSFESGHYTLAFDLNDRVGPVHVVRIHPGHEDEAKEAAFQIHFN